MVADDKRCQSRSKAAISNYEATKEPERSFKVGYFKSYFEGDRPVKK